MSLFGVNISFCYICVSLLWMLSLYFHCNGNCIMGSRDD